MSENPFAFRVNDEKMNSEFAANYFPPEKRQVMKDYLSKSSV